ncbi:hypothetical protein V4U86_20550 [Mycobacterium sp. AMU20-3851]|uniref:YveK family protein n=1 Tax=Mycobacterium sp. AMU20-3851 TaxID=3122055 RepID=UPI003754ED06
MRAPVDVPRLRDYLAMLLRAWPMILVATLLSAGAAAVVVAQKTPTYTASALAFAKVSNDPSTFSQYYGGMGAKLRMPGYAELAKSRSVAQRAIEAIGEDTTAEDLASRISAEWEPSGVDLRGRANSVLLRITVTNENPDLAVEEVNAVGSVLVKLSQDLEWYESEVSDDVQYKGPLAELLPVGVATAARPVPNPILGPMTVGAGVGFALSVLIMLSVQIARDTLVTRSQINQIARVATQREA